MVPTEKELLDLGNSATSLTELISDLDMRLSTEFKTGIEKINTQLCPSVWWRIFMGRITLF